MVRPRPVPDELARRPFAGSDAIRRGLVTKNELRGPSWVRLFRDVYVRRGLESDARVRFAALRLKVTTSDAVVCGRTAAWLHGVWQPPPGVPLPLELSAPLDDHGRKVRGLCRRRLTVLHGDAVESGGFLVTSPERTCFDLMRRHRLVEAVVVADGFAFAGAITLPALRSFCGERRKWPGVTTAKQASDLAHEFARSPGESRLRMVVVLAGYDEPLVNVPVHGPRGEHLGTPDLAVRGRRWVHLEYDGAYHDEAAQHGRDLRRQNAMQGYGGVPLLRFDWRHVLHQRHEVLRHLAMACGQQPRQDLDDRDFLRGAAEVRW